MIADTMLLSRGARSRETPTLPARQDVYRLSEDFIFEENSGGARFQLATIEPESQDYVAILGVSVNYTTVNAKDWLRFQWLKDQWRNERNPIVSSVETLTRSKSYQEIIGLGEKAIPFILSELRSEGDEPDHWFPALAAITGENPVPPESRGRIQEMALAWLKWGETHV